MLKLTTADVRLTIKRLRTVTSNIDIATQTINNITVNLKYNTNNKVYTIICEKPVNSPGFFYVEYYETSAIKAIKTFYNKLQPGQ